MRNWIIKKLGGFTREEIGTLERENLERENMETLNIAKEELREGLRKILISVRGDCPKINKTLKWQKDFVNSMCKFLEVKKLW